MMRQQKWRGLIIFEAITFVSVAAAQNIAPQQTGKPPLLNPLRLPLPLQGSVAALGSRLQAPGNERSVLSGTITLSTGNSQAQVTSELPNKVRIDLAGPAARSIGFDGNVTWASTGTVTENDEDLLETFFEDSPESMLNAVLKSASLRVVATHARMDDGQTPARSVDIYQVVGPTQSRAAKSVRQKHYYFDSNTRLLVEVDYLIQRSDGSTAGVRVQRSNWQSTGGQAAPGIINRMESGKVVASFATASTTFSAAASDGKFSAP